MVHTRLPVWRVAWYYRLLALDDGFSATSIRQQERPSRRTLTLGSAVVRTPHLLVARRNLHGTTPDLQIALQGVVNRDLKPENLLLKLTPEASKRHRCAVHGCSGGTVARLHNHILRQVYGARTGQQALPHRRLTGRTTALDAPVLPSCACMLEYNTVNPLVLQTCSAHVDKDEGSIYRTHLSTQAAPNGGARAAA